MSGHSKWSKVKHQKKSVDLARGKIFTKFANAIIIAVKAGGGSDRDTNFKLRLAIERARSVNMPNENIQRAIDHAKGAGKESEISEVLYEAFTAKSVGILIKCATDNKQRSVAEIKNILERHGGVLAESGAVSHFFNQLGVIEIDKNEQNSERILELSAESGAIDIEESESGVLVYTNPSELHKISELLIKGGLKVKSSELIFKPVATIPVKESDDNRKIDNLIDALEEREDVTAVFTNRIRGY